VTFQTVTEFVPYLSVVILVSYLEDLQGSSEVTSRIIFRNRMV
jgi:hypothetical protein